MVLGDLGSYSIYALFQRELEEEMNVLEKAFLDFQQDADRAEALSLMLMSISAIYGSAKLVDLSEIESMTRLMNACIKELQLDSTKPLGLLEEGIKLLLDLSVCKEQELPKWRKEHSKQIEDFNRRLQKSLKVEPFSQDHFSVQLPTRQAASWDVFIECLFEKSKALQKALCLLEEASKEDLTACLDKINASLKNIEMATLNFPAIANLARDARQHLQKANPDLDFVFHACDLFFYFSSLCSEDFEDWIENHNAPSSFIRESLAKETKDLNDFSAVKKLKSSSEKLLSLCAKNLCQITDLQSVEARQTAISLYRKALSSSVCFFEPFLDACISRYTSLGLNILVKGRDLGVEKSVFERLSVILEALLDLSIEEKHIDCRLTFSVKDKTLVLDFAGPCLPKEQVLAMTGTDKEIDFRQLFESKFFSGTDLRYLRSLQSLYHASKREGILLEVLNDETVRLKFGASLFGIKAFLAKTRSKIYAFKQKQVQRVESFDPARLQKDNGQLFYTKTQLPINDLGALLEKDGFQDKNFSLVCLKHQAYLFEEVMGREFLYFAEQKSPTNSFFDLPSLCELARLQYQEADSSVISEELFKEPLFLFEEA